MKIILIICVITIIVIFFWQVKTLRRGRVTYREFISKSISGNSAGEDSKRRISIYLPKGYERGSQRYPVIYFLHGFHGDEGDINERKLDELLDAAIADQRIKPVILVVPGSATKYGGSFYSNSTFTGHWADYIGLDVVQYVDQNFRTIPEKNSRGLAGHSMGGNGALKIGMLFPGVFGSIYALSPSVLDWGAELTVNHPGFQVIQTAKNLEEISQDIYAHIFLDLGRTYSPNPDKPPHYANLPAEYKGDLLIINDSVVSQWEANFPLRMLDRHIESIKGLKGLKIDWGRDDLSEHIPFTCKLFSKKLKEYGVVHEAEEYAGGHGEKVAGESGRFNMELIPFFARHLSFETVK
jgi:pimeloyl-ACP methyl ester carboxylesterase